MGLVDSGMIAEAGFRFESFDFDQDEPSQGEISILSATLHTTISPLAEIVLWLDGVFVEDLTI